MDPGERRWLIIGGSIAIAGVIGLVVVVALWSAPKGLLESNGFVVCLVVTVLGLALIVAAGARDALLVNKETEIVTLTRPGGIGSPGEPSPVATVKVHPVFRNAPQGDNFRTRYELVIDQLGAIEGLLLEAAAPSILSVRFDDVSIDHQEAGGGSGHAWARMLNPPLGFRVDVITSGLERTIRIDLSAL